MLADALEHLREQRSAENSDLLRQRLPRLSMRVAPASSSPAIANAIDAVSKVATVRVPPIEALNPLDPRLTAFAIWMADSTFFAGAKTDALFVWSLGTDLICPRCAARACGKQQSIDDLFTTAPPMTVSGALEQVKAGHHADALDLLLEAWREVRSSEVADVIDSLSRVVLAHEPPIVSLGKISEKQAWEAVFESHRPAAFPRLLESLAYNYQALNRIKMIKLWELDPRITHYAREWMTTRAPLTNQNRIPFYQALFDILTRTGDMRIAATLLDITGRAARPHTIRRLGMRNWKLVQELATHFAKEEAKAKAEGAHALTAEEQEALASIRSIVSAAQAPAFSMLASSAAEVTQPQLFRRVYENPSDDEARAVLGDFLQQDADPRGEFIALQLARWAPAVATKKRATKRERDLEKQWGRIWLGPVAPYIRADADGVIYERGFPARCQLAYSHMTGGMSAIEPFEEWSTVTHIDMAYRSRDASVEWLKSPVLHRALRHVRGVALGNLSQYTENTAVPFPWTTLGVNGWSVNELAVLFDGPRTAFPHVRHLIASLPTSIVSQEDALRILAAWSLITDFEAVTRDEEIAALLVAPAVRRRLERIVINGSGFRFEKNLGGSKTLHLNITNLWEQTNVGLVPAVRAVLERSRGEDFIDHIHVTADPNSKVRLVDNKHLQTRYTKLDISQLRAAADSESVRITFLTEK